MLVDGFGLMVEIISEGVGDAMRKANNFCRYTRPEYMSYTFQLALVDKLVIHAQPCRSTPKK